MMKKIDLNCDMGESFGNYKLGQDKEIMKYISSANIACGFHAGDSLVMNETVKNCVENKIQIGAHPGFPDLQGFGRRNMAISPDEARAYMIHQLGALDAFAKVHGGKIKHVKPHGALYNMAAKDEGLASALAQAVYDYNPELTFVGLANSYLIKAGKAAGLKVANEVFADRAYQDDGSLVPRSMEGAVIHDEDLCIERVLKMVEESEVESINGNMVKLDVDTICLHGDNEKAILFAEKINKALKGKNIIIEAKG